MSALAIGLILSGQITFSTPLHWSRGRSAAFVMILPLGSNGSYSGIWLPLESTRPRRSPLRNESLGTVTRLVERPFLVQARSYAKKKNALLRPSKTLGTYTGPPMLPPGSHWRVTGRTVGVNVNPRALKASLRLKTNPDPCRPLVPDLVTQLMTPLEVWPNSAE